MVKAKASKRYVEAVKLIETEKEYTPEEAFELLNSMPKAKFDESVEAHIKLGIDPRHADQQVRGTTTLPHGMGKEVRVAVFAEGDKAREAEQAGAEIVGTKELAAKIEKGWLEFDVAVATPDAMSTVGKIGKILGPRGLMPNPKAGTVTFDIGKAVSDLKAGKIEYRVDKYGIVHQPIGRRSFEAKELLENYSALLDEIIRARPAAAKGKYLKSISISSTMGPSIKIETS